MKGGQCSRNATYVDEKDGQMFCTQHAREFATVNKKASKSIRVGLIPISQNQE